VYYASYGSILCVSRVICVDSMRDSTCVDHIWVICVSRIICVDSTRDSIRVDHLSILRPTQSIIYVPLQVIGFHKIILLIVPYKYLKSCPEDFILKNLILRTRSCGTAFITQQIWLLYFRQAEICLVKMICTTVVPASKRHLGGASP